MADLPRLVPPESIRLALEPLTPSSFAPFGTVITSPLPPTTTIIPTSQPQSSVHPDYQPRPVFANQDTALKTSPISALTDNYSSSSTTTSPTTNLTNPQSKGLLSVFSCFPRSNDQQSPYSPSSSPASSKSAKRIPTLRINIIERHPYTTQTFCPFNLSQPSPSASSDKTHYLVVVAPTLSTPSTTPINIPDLSRIRAFYAPLGNDSVPGTAVTYAPGTWHAPMIVLGSRRVDFLVTQFANGVANDDCQEVWIGSAGGDDEQRVVEVDLSVLNLSPEEDEHARGKEIDTESGGLWSPREQRRGRETARKRRRDTKL